MLGIFLGIFLFFFLVVIHELGHFFAAKKTGVQVLEFGVGIPPKLGTVWTDKSGTEYTINMLPLGGFVRLKGEDPSDSKTFLAKDSFITASFVSKTIILLAGVTVNFVFARFVLTLLFWRGMSPLMIVPENSTTIEIKSYLTPTISFLQEKQLLGNLDSESAQVQRIMTGSLGDTIGFQEGDVITTINTLPVHALNFSNVLKSFIGKEIRFTVTRGGKDIDLLGQCPDDNCILGLGMNGLSKEINIVYKFGFWKSNTIALQELYYQAKITLYRLGKFGSSLLSFSSSNIQKEAKNFSGPVGAVKFGDMLVQNNQWSQFLAFGALISFALAIFNLLPIPALDGGRWLGVIIQTLFFRNKQEQYFVIENYINVVFFILLMVLGVYIILKDLVVAWGVNIPFMG